MKIYLAADHGGYELKEAIKKWLQENHYEFEDCGAFTYDPEDDYPDFVFPAVEKVTQDKTGQDRAIIGCRSSGGAVIAANKVKGIRAVSVFDIKSTEHAVTNNDANVIGVSGDWSSEAEAIKIVAAFLTTKFPGAGRHARRIEKIAEYEEKHSI